MRYAQATDGREVSHLLLYSVGTETIIEYLLPLGINLRKGIVIQIDGVNFPTEALSCDTPGCVGFAPLTPELLERLKAGKALKLAFSPRGSDQFYSFDYSLIGFTAQYDAFVAGGSEAPEPQ